MSVVWLADRRKLAVLSLMVFLKRSIFFAVLALSTEAAAALRFEVRFPASVRNEPVDGRLLVMLSTKGDREPRFQIDTSLESQQVFGGYGFAKDELVIAFGKGSLESAGGKDTPITDDASFKLVADKLAKANSGVFYVNVTNAVELADQLGVGADNSRKGQRRELREPGSLYEYNDVRVNALGYALLRRFRKPLPDVLRERIMDKVGASQGWRWEGYETSWVEIDGQRMQSVPGGGHWGGGLFISARDHARFGQLIAQNGVWEGRELVPSSWLAQSVVPSPTLPNYGFLWWLNRGPAANPKLPASAFSAQGAGNNLIWIDPEHELVAVLRWIDKAAIDGFLERLVAAVE